MSYMDELNFWLNDDYFDQKTKDELLAIRNNEAEVEDRFYKELEFGTGGLRGVIGAGTNRMNVYTVRKATQGLHGMIILDGLYFGDDVLIDRSGYLCAVLPVYFVAVVLRRVVACSHYDTCGTSQRTKGKGQFRGRS